MSEVEKWGLAGVMGWPVSHSLSPRLHGYWINEYNIAGSYVPIAVEPDRLEQAVRALPALGFAGVNLTIPHKETVMPFLDDISEMARMIGAVNLITVAVDGSLCGDNTDAYGFLAALRDCAPSWSAATGPAVVFGAGGASRAVIAALVMEGVSEIRLVNRTGSRADALAERFGKTVSSIDWSARHETLGDAALIVNTTQCGMNGENPLDLSLGSLNDAAVVNDIVYVPLETPLLRDAAARGNPTVDGLGMLLHQAAPAFHAWYGIDPPVTDSLRDHMLAAS